MQTYVMGRSQSGRAPRAAVVSMLLFALMVWSPSARTAPAKEATVPTDIEAWYYTSDDQADDPPPVPFLPDPVNPYGENTLHVGITAGEEDARTYLALDFR